MSNTKLKTRKIQYLIDMSPIGDSPLKVDGYAVDSPTGVRYCVREVYKTWPFYGTTWLLDHYDTGGGFLRACTFSTQQEAIRVAEASLVKKIVSGDYQRVLDKWNKGGI